MHVNSVAFFVDKVGHDLLHWVETLSLAEENSRILTQRVHRKESRNLQSKRRHEEGVLRKINFPLPFKVLFAGLRLK